MGFMVSRSSLLSISLMALATLATAQVLKSDSPASTPLTYAAMVLPAQDIYAALVAVKSGDGARARVIMTSTTDPVVRKLMLWALVDGAPASLSFLEAETAVRDLAGWPHIVKRELAAEQALNRSGLSNGGIVAWFSGRPPRTPQGVMALAGALRNLGQAEAARILIVKTWREVVFDEETQEIFLAKFGKLLTGADHLARADLLLYGPQGRAALDVVNLLPPEQRAVAQARIALRRDDENAAALINALPVQEQLSPGLAYERVLKLRDSGKTNEALALMRYLPTQLPNDAAAERLWHHGILVVAALQKGDYANAYAAAAHAGLANGADAANAEFYAGWIALSRLKNPKLADEHFERLQNVGQSPLTQSRALYWRGRTADAAGDLLGAQIFYGQSAKFNTTFYGLLAAIRAGDHQLSLGHDPLITTQTREAFEARDWIRATRLLDQVGAHETHKVFLLGLSEIASSATDEALLFDMARDEGDLGLAMRIVRNGARHGIVLPERGYPVRAAPQSPLAPETPLILGITRQESSFDPRVRSPVGARGMMQLMPATASSVARRMGLGNGNLDDPDYNMRVGSTFLGQLVNQFSGSYVMATAAYNAGASRPTAWTSVCGDPRGGSSDPLDFIECIPFSETRDYVMRVLEATQVYRARLAGGVAANTLEADLRRGGYSYRLTASMVPVTVEHGGAGVTLVTPALPPGRDPNQSR